MIVSDEVKYRCGGLHPVGINISFKNCCRNGNGKRNKGKRIEKCLFTLLLSPFAVKVRC